jgi:hypothetical protein
MKYSKIRKNKNGEKYDTASKFDRSKKGHLGLAQKTAQKLHFLSINVL